MEMQELRSLLASRRGEWTRLAAMAGVNRRTIYRIVNDDGYMPNLKTFLDLDRAVRADEQKVAA